MASEQLIQLRGAIRRYMLAGAILVVVLAGGVGGWAATTEISGAVIATGSVVVESNVKKVQHPSGGIVGTLAVREGAYVNAGDLLVRLDDTMTRASLAIVTKNLREMNARKARLEAERDGRADIVFPDTLAGEASIPEVAALLAGERRLFELRQTARTGQKDQLRQRIAQLKEELNGHEAQRTAKSREIELIERELKGARELFGKNLMPITKLTALEREATRLNGERGQIIAASAQAKGRIAEIELQIVQIDRELSSEVSRDLRETEARIGEYVERQIAAEDQLRRIDIRAPQAGTVLQLAVHTVGGVIGGGEVLMLIVPHGDDLTIEVKVSPADIDQLSVGQPALMRFSAFNQRTTPEVEGKVERIAADVTTDQRSGMSYYVVRIALPDEQLKRLGDVKLVPGMPVEAFMKTGDRKVLSYLVKPLTDQFSRAFREK